MKNFKPLRVRWLLCITNLQYVCYGCSWDQHPTAATLRHFQEIHKIKTICLVQFSRSVMTESSQPHEPAALQASLSITNSRSPPKSMSIESVMPSNHLILCHPLFLLPSIFPSTRVFPNESALFIRWPKYWSFSFSISPSNEHPGQISFRMDWLDLLAVQGTLKRVFSNTTVPQHQFFCAQHSL